MYDKKERENVKLSDINYSWFTLTVCVYIPDHFLAGHSILFCPPIIELLLPVEKFYNSNHQAKLPGCTKSGKIS